MRESRTALLLAALSSLSVASAGYTGFDVSRPIESGLPRRSIAGKKYRREYSARGDAKRVRRRETIAKIIAEREQPLPAKYMHSAARRRQPHDR